MTLNCAISLQGMTMTEMQKRLLRMLADCVQSAQLPTRDSEYWVVQFKPVPLTYAEMNCLMSMQNAVLENECGNDVFPDHPEWNVKCNLEPDHSIPCGKIETIRA